MDINFGQGKSNFALGQIIECLEAHYAVLEAELVEITKDLKKLEQMKIKYGNAVNSLTEHLQTLKQQRKTELKKIQSTMTKLDFDAEKGQKLLAQLERSREQ